MPTYNRVVYHEAKHENDVTAECTKINVIPVRFTPAIMLSLPLDTSLNQTSKQASPICEQTKYAR